MTRTCPYKEPHFGPHTWGDTTYAEDMGVMWETCPGIEFPESVRRYLPPLTDTNGEELIERALRERRGEI
jgi:hypothetical protein